MDSGEESAPGGEGDGEHGRRGALIALAVIVVLGLAGLYVAHRLHSAAAIQDCVMQGRSNCVQIQTPSR